MGMPELFDGSKKILSKVQEERAQAAEEKKSRSVTDYSEVMRRFGSSTAAVTSFATLPCKTSFSSQARGEQIILLLRKHPITQLKWIFISLALALIPILFSGIPFLSFLPGRFEFAALVCWYLLIIGYSLEAFLSWFFNVCIITDERIVDVDFLSLLYHDVASAKLENIEDITSVTGGTMRAILDYGSVRIQTAGSQTEFEFEDVPHPAEVTKLLNELLLEEEREKLEGRVS